MLRSTPFHFIPLSPWPLFLSLSIFLIVQVFLYGFLNRIALKLSIFSLSLLFLIMLLWSRDIMRELTLQGFYSMKLYQNLVIGLLFFIASEVILFFSFFWAFFHFSLSPSINTGLMFPPLRVEYFNPIGVPLLNTVILLMSGVILTYSHYSMLSKNWYEGAVGLTFTIILRVIFLFFQKIEYTTSSFTMAHSNYGSIFFTRTRFHGAHVLLGTRLLMASLVRYYIGHFSINYHIGFLFAIWYWHFVDVVWVILFLFFYCWAVI